MYYKLYVLDQGDAYSEGSNEVTAATLNVQYPLSDDMESGTENWDAGPSWGLTDEDAHGGSFSWTDSPGSNYGNNIDASLRTSIDLSAGVIPVLSFWHRYQLESYKDFGYVEVSTDNGVTWYRLYFATGTQAEWREVRIDLSSYAHLPQVMVRFRLTSNESLTYDGWYIDDVKVEESTKVIAYPFFDAMETQTDNWHASSWGIVSGGHSGDNCFTDSPLGNYVRSGRTSLSLAGVIDLSEAVNPQLTFWNHYRIASDYNDDRAYVQVAYHDGQVWHWSNLATYNEYGSHDNWERIQLDLSPYAGQSHVKIRFYLEDSRVRYEHDGWYIDDVWIGEENAVPMVTLATTTQSVTEDVGSVSIIAILSAASDLEIVVPYTVSGTATGNGTDYDLADGTIIIPAGQTTATKTFNVLDDDLGEPYESIVVTMGAPTNATAGSIITHTITITDNDELPKHTLFVAKAGSGSGTVTSTPEGIECGDDCSGTYNHGMSVVLRATPDIGSFFSGWLGGGCSGTEDCTLTIDAGMTVTATFDPEITCNYSITPTADFFHFSGGTGSLDITASNGCSWSVTTGDGWITITSNPSGNGDGSVNYSVSENTGDSSRSGNIIIAGENSFSVSFPVTQEWAGTNAGVALDMLISTRNYVDTLSSTDIESTAEAAEFGEIWVGVVAQGVTNLAAYQIEVSFDPARVEFIAGAEENPFDGISNFLKKNGGETEGFQASEIASGTVKIANSLSDSDCDKAPEGTGIIGLLNLRVLDGDPDNQVTLDSALFVNCNGGEEEITNLSNGSINLYPQWDFNGDGIVNYLDLGLFADHWLLKEDDPGWDSKYNLSPVPDSGKQIINYLDLGIFADHWLEEIP